MNNELILTKSIIKLGNSAGVLLPKEWLNGKARVELINKPLNIEEDVLEIISEYLSKVIGVFIVGSYARNEQKEDSDVDILVITQDVNARIEKGKYDIILISKQELEKQIENNALPIIPMLIEAKSIINSYFISEYKKAGFTRKNLRFHIATTYSALKVIKSYLDLKELKKDKFSDNIIYSLILRLRELYIVDCINKNKIPTTKGLLSIIKDLAGNYEPYNAYKRAKISSSKLERVSLEQTKNLYSYMLNKLKEQEKWIRHKESK